MLEAFTLRDERPQLVLALIEARFPAGTHEVYQVPIGRHGQLLNQVRTVPLTGAYVHDPTGFNGNGITLTPDGRAVIIVQSSTGFLFRVDPEAGLRMLDRRNQLINQCSVVHRLSPFGPYSHYQNGVLSLFGDSCFLTFFFRESTRFSRAVHPPTSLFGTAETRALPILLIQTLSAARNFALRARGLRPISSSPGVTGFFVSNLYCHPFAPSRIASFTMRSSSE